MTDIRVTSLVKEVVVKEVAPDQRVTAAGVEALRSTPADLRVTAAAIEVLRTVASPAISSGAKTIVCIASSGN